MAEATPAPDPPEWMVNPCLPRVNFNILSPSEVRALYRLTDWETLDENDCPEIRDEVEEDGFTALSDGAEVEHRYVGPYDAGTPWEGSIGVNEHLKGYLSDLPEHDYERAVAVYTAFAESLLPEDRMTIMGWGHRLVDLAQVDHDLAMTMWDRFMRSPIGELLVRCWCVGELLVSCSQNLASEYPGTARSM